MTLLLGNDNKADSSPIRRRRMSRRSRRRLQHQLQLSTRANSNSSVSSMSSSNVAAHANAGMPTGTVRLSTVSTATATAKRPPFAVFLHLILVVFLSSRKTLALSDVRGGETPQGTASGAIQAASVTLQPEGKAREDGKNQWVATVRFAAATTSSSSSSSSSHHEQLQHGAVETIPYESCTEIVEKESSTTTTTATQTGEENAKPRRRRVVCIRGHIETFFVDDDDDDDDDAAGAGGSATSKVPEASATASTSTTASTSSSSFASAASTASAHVIRVGDKVYQAPFDAYGSGALRRHFYSHPMWATGGGGGGSGASGGGTGGATAATRAVDPADEADWLIELGYLYQQQRGSSPDDEEDGDGNQQEDATATTKTGIGDGPRRRGVAGALASGSGVRRATALLGGSNSHRASGPAMPASASMHSVSLQEQRMEHSINAYKQAIRILQGIVRSGASWIRTQKEEDHYSNDERNEYLVDAKFLLANTYFAMSDAYAGISGAAEYGDDADDDDDVDSARQNRPSRHPLAVSYMKLAEKSYRQILASPVATLDRASARTAQTARAVCCVRLGVLMLEDPRLDAALAQLGAADSEESLSDLTRQYYQLMADQGELAMGYFREAADHYQQHTNIGSKDSKGTTETETSTSAALEFDYATVLHNMATASTYRGRDHEMTANFAKQAIEHYQAVLDRSRMTGVGHEADSDFSTAAVPSAAGELLLLVSDSYLKLGRYEDSKAYYAKCMAWYAQYDLSAPLTSTGMMPGSLDGAADSSAVSEAIEDYERTLDEYKTLLQEQSGVLPEGAEGDDASYDVEPQDGYEGDLHMNLGSLYMANGDIYTAISHLQQASLLYGRSTEKGDETNVADVKFTLAALLFRNADYQASIQLHGQALDLYKQHGGGSVSMDEGIPSVQPRVTFALDPLEGDAEVDDGHLSSERHEPVASDVRADSDPILSQGSASSGKTHHQGRESTGGDNRAGKADPVLAMMDYWYAALANDTDASNNHDAGPPQEHPDDTSRPHDTGKDEL